MNHLVIERLLFQKRTHAFFCVYCVCIYLTYCIQLSILSRGGASYVAFSTAARRSDSSGCGNTTPPNANPAPGACIAMTGKLAYGISATDSPMGPAHRLGCAVERSCAHSERAEGQDVKCHQGPSEILPSSQRASRQSPNRGVAGLHLPAGWPLFKSSVSRSVSVASATHIHTSTHPHHTLTHQREGERGRGRVILFRPLCLPCAVPLRRR